MIGEAQLLYLVGFLGVGLLPAWMSFTECQRAADPAPLGMPKAKRYVLAAMAWDLSFAYAGGGSVWGIQRFAGADLGGTYSAATIPQQGALVAVVGVLATGVGVGARALGGAAARRNRRARGRVDATNVVINYPGNPKTRAIERLGNLEWLWTTSHTLSAAQDVVHLGRDTILYELDLFFRTKGLTSVVTEKAIAAGGPLSLRKLLASLPTILDDTAKPFVRRVQVLLLLVMENGGKDFVAELVERGRTEFQLGQSKAHLYT